MRKSTLKEKAAFIICMVMMILALAFLVVAINYMAKNIWAGYINWNE